MSLLMLAVVPHGDSFVGQQQHCERSVQSAAAAVELLLSLRKVHWCTSILVLTLTSILLSLYQRQLREFKTNATAIT